MFGTHASNQGRTQAFLALTTNLVREASPFALGPNMFQNSPRLSER